jgi:hypothetical protein
MVGGDRRRRVTLRARVSPGRQDVTFQHPVGRNGGGA